MMFGKEKEKIRDVEWDWSNFESTKNYPVSENLLDWVIGQDQALKECYLCLDEWVHKLKWMQKEEWYKAWEDPNAEKPQAKKFIPAGPYLLLLGDAGTGKSLIGRALAGHLTELYKTTKVKLRDVLCWQNKLIPSEPKISTHKAGDGKKIVQIEKLKHQKKKRLSKFGINVIKWFLIGIASILVSIGLYKLWGAYLRWLDNPMTMSGRLQATYAGNFMEYMMDQFLGIALTVFVPAGMMLIFLVLIFIMGRFGMMGGAKGIAGAEQTDAPKLIVDNSMKVAPFIDATGHTSPQLFGSIAWDPLQTGGLGTPEHQRTSAGDCHRANLGILYIDEIKNLHATEAVTLLTVLEEGQLPIAIRSKWEGGGTSAMAVSTEPVPCLTFLVGAGNFDSIPQIHPALMDRIYGYGKVVRMNNDMPNTVENRRKYVQFISQEAKRFRMPPFSRDACEEIVAEGRRRSGKRDRLTTKFRPLISIIKTSGTLAINEGINYTEEFKGSVIDGQPPFKWHWDFAGLGNSDKQNASFTFKSSGDFKCILTITDALGRSNSDVIIVHVPEPFVERKHVVEAILEHCKTIQKQLLEHAMEERGELLDIKPEGIKLGSIYGLAIVKDEYSGEMTGTVLPVKGYIEKRSKIEKKSKETVKAYFDVTGIAKQDHAIFIDDSVSKVRTVMLQKYGVDVAQHYFSHIDFAQSHGVDGPSAGVTMTLLLCSLIEGKPIDQTIAVTGEINIGIGNEIKITAVGGVHEKIRAAEAWGFKKVIIPMKNLKYSVNPKDYKLEVVGAETLDDYLKECLINEE